MLSRKLQCLFILVITICKFSIGFKCYAKKNLNTQFDTLMFVQQWPSTYCTSLLSEGKQCKVPPQSGIWTVHGIWPSRFNTKVDEQPSCCDPSVHINVDGIKEQLKRNWPSVQKEKPDEDFWEYEWLKHGTCSVMDPLRYFNQALYWVVQYNMTSILAKSNIIPENEKSYKLIDIHTALKTVLNRNPSINCYIDRTTSEQYLNEIRLCFDRQLELIDCDGVDRRRSKGNVISNCLDKPIHYRVDLVDQATEWFTYFAYFGLVLFVLFIAVLLKNTTLGQRLFRNTESIPFFNINR